MLGTRPDIAFAILVISRFLLNLNCYHLKAINCILKYLQGTIDLELIYLRELKDLTGYLNAN
jgi:hypothetical protein